MISRNLDNLLLFGGYHTGQNLADFIEHTHGSLDKSQSIQLSQLWTPLTNTKAASVGDVGCVPDDFLEHSCSCLPQVSGGPGCSNGRFYSIENGSFPDVAFAKITSEGKEKFVEFHEVQNLLPKIQSVGGEVLNIDQSSSTTLRIDRYEYKPAKASIQTFRLTFNFNLGLSVHWKRFVATYARFVFPDLPTVDKQKVAGYFLIHHDLLVKYKFVVSKEGFPTFPSPYPKDAKSFQKHAIALASVM